MASPALTRIVNLVARPITNRITYVARCGVAAGLRRQGGMGFLHRAQSDEEIFVRSIDLKGKTVFDVGAFEGLFTLRFASEAARVVTFEPHPWCQATTMRNVALNGFGNVTLVPVALADQPGIMTLSYPEHEPARSTIEPATITVLHRTGYERLKTMPVLVWTLDDAFSTLKLPAPDLIKIDAEGAEAGIVRGAMRVLREHSPVLYIELHSGKGPEVASILREAGYHVWHLETRGNYSDGGGHIWCDPPSGSRVARPAHR
jgi:FkbM family methyltransferase